MDVGILKRTTYIVNKASASAEFFQEVFGWTIWYDNQLMADHRFPPVGSQESQKVHLIILQAKDPKLGKLGLLEYVVKSDVTPKTEPKSIVRTGEPILVIESEDIEGVYHRAKERGANVITPPVDWFVPSPDGESKIHLRTVSLFDPNGIYMEVSDHPGRK